MTSPSNGVYVGLTLNLPRRIRNYKRLNCSAQSLLYNSLSKYGFDSFKFEVIDSFEGTHSDAKSKEIFWIRTNMSNRNKYPDFNGLNLTNGGEGKIGCKMPETQKEFLRDLYKGKAFFTGFKHTEEAKQKMSEKKKGKESPHKGKVRSLDACLRNSESKKNNTNPRVVSEETRAKLRLHKTNTSNKPVIITSDSETLEFRSLRKTSIFLGIGISLIKRIIDGFNDNKFNNYTIKYK